MIEFTVWVGVFAYCETAKTALMDLRIDYILTPSPLARYIQEHK